MAENDLTYAIRKGIFDVYNTLGSGLLESVYEKALIIELESQGLEVKSQFAISVIYKEIDLGIAF